MPDPATTAGRIADPGGGGAARWVLAPVVIAVVALGVWVTGGLITDDFTVAMLLSAAWMGAAGLVCLGIAMRRRDLRAPVMGAYLLTAVVIGGYLGYTTFVGQEEDDALIEATAPAPAAADGAAPAPGGEGGAAAAGPALLSTGAFESLAHATTGAAEIVQDGDRLVLQLRDFETDPGPDLRLYLATDAQASDFKDLGAVGNTGNKQVTLPDGIDLDRYGTVLIWCRAFSVGFGAAELGRP